jgi:O-antigen biosynthesis protein
MNGLFSNLLVSAPNGGGLFYINNGEVKKLDSFNTVGLFATSRNFYRAIQPDAVWAYGATPFQITDESVSLGDVHDVLEFEDHLYVVGTTGNEVIKLDSHGIERDRWRFPGEEDSRHVNCLGVWNGRVVYSAFGEFSQHRGYKGMSDGEGFVEDLFSGKRLISGLSQPHTPVGHGANLLIANSERSELREYAPDGQLLKVKTLPGYTRGISVTSEAIYVGMSKSRNLDGNGLTSAVLIALDPSSWDELGRVALPSSEIYSVVSITDDAELLWAVSELTSHASLKLEQRITQLQDDAAREHVASMQRREYIDAINQVVRGRLEENLTDSKNDKKKLEDVVNSERSLSTQAQSDELDGLVSAKRMIEVLENQERFAQGRVRQLEGLNEESEARSRASLERLLEVEATLTAVMNSRTWRWTEPVRRANASMSPMKQRIKNDLYRAYRALPMASHNKQKLKGVLFRYFGFAFKNVSAYKAWKDYQELSTTWPTRDDGTSKRTAQLQMNAQENLQLGTADGVWEWQDYAAVRDRISQVKGAEGTKFAPKPIDVIDIKASMLPETVAGLRFVEPGAEPLVSIIIPVFNNVKLTVECLESLHRHLPASLMVEIIIADDASSDETQALLQSIPNVKYIRNEQNLGFLLNCNNALNQVTGRYTLYLNNDVQVTAGWLEALLSTFDKYENVGAVGPKFVYPTGYLQEAGASLAADGTSTMVGLHGNPDEPRYNYTRRVDYVSGACLLTHTHLLKKLGGFSEDFLPCYCEDSDLCLSIRSAGYDIYYNPGATIIHHLSKTTAASDESFKMACIAKNVSVLNRKWASTIEKKLDPRIITFFLPQFHPVPENDLWWGKGFTEWTNVSKARPNFVGHDQPRIPADHGYYDLRLLEVLQAQADLAQRYGVHGFCFYYYWFDGKRLLERPVEQLLLSDKPDIPFCLCWANENWTRRWDGQENEVLMAQAHTDEDDVAVIYDLIRFFKDDRYIKIDGRPLILIYRATLFPDFARTAATWRKVCREQGLGEIYIAMVESFELVQSNTHPSALGCDAAVEFPPQGLAEVKQPSGEIINPDFVGSVADYRDLAVRYATRPAPGYTRFKGVMPGWDNTARRQHNGFCFENTTPGAFQAWLEESIADTKEQHFGDERLVFVNAWNEWAEGAYLEPDRRFGHTYLEAVRNATDASRLLKKN